MTALDPAAAASAALRELLDDLVRAGVQLHPDPSGLRCSAPRGTLTGSLLTRLRSAREELLVQLRADGVSAEAPLAPVQQALWRHQHLRPGDTAYHIPVELVLRGPLHPEALRAALTTVVRRQAALRTVFPVRWGRPVQHVRQPEPVAVRLADLSGLTAAEADRVAGEIAATEATRGFDLATGPVLRATLLRMGDREHRLLITRHHIASDGWSFGVLAQDLAAAHRAHRGALPAPVAPTWRYTDHARWQRDRAEQCRGGAQRLAQGPAAAGFAIGCLPGGEPAPGRAAGVVRAHCTGAAVAAVARAAGTTPFTVWVTAFGLALAGRSGQPDVVLGTPVGGRTHPAAEQLVGCFAGLLPLRVGGGPAATFRAALRAAHDATTTLLRHQDVPLEAVLDAVRDSAGATAGAHGIRAVLAFQNTPPACLDLGDVDVALLDGVPLAPKFPLTLTVTPGPATPGPAGHDDTHLLAEYATDLVDRALVDDLLARVRTAVQAMAHNLDRPWQPVLAPLPAAVPAVAAAGPDPLAPAAPPGDARETLAARFAAVAAAVPDAVAVSDRRHQLTYRALQERASALGGALRGCGAGPERLVAVRAAHTVHLVVGVLGVLVSGAAYLPIDPEDPPARQEQLLTEAGVGAVVADAAGADALAWFDGPVLRVDDPAGPDPAGAPADPGPAAVRDNLAYVIHTSGSTGGPKGVLITHGNVLELFRAAAPACRVTASDVWSLNHSIAFDFSVWELWGALLHGGRLVAVPRELARDPAALWELLGHEQVTLHSATPTALALLTAALPADGGRGALRTLVLGGERCRPADLAEWLTAAHRGPDGPDVVNMYGITETTVHVTHRLLGAADVADADGSPIGRPLPGVDAVIEGGDPAEPGAGELAVGGWGTARGYLNRPGLTADRFRPAGGGRPGGRRYRSGDRVVLGPDGLAYLGRTDRQVIIRGHRVEPDELAAVLGGHPAIAAAAVRVRDRAGRVELLACYVPDTAAGRPAPAQDELRRYLADRLPRQLLPAGFVALDRLPLTRNGKLDHDALPTEIPAPVVSQPPRTRTERTLAALWCTVLLVDQVGRYDDFFALGGDSLQATRLHALLQDEFGVELPLGGLYAAFDVATLAAAIDDRLAGVATPVSRVPHR